MAGEICYLFFLCIQLQDKNDPQVCGDNKRKAETADVVAPSGQNKILKQGFTCELCPVSATSREGLHDHFRGKKHRKKEAIITEISGLEDDEAVHSSMAEGQRES